MISGKKILIGITGSIAAYKMPQFVRMLTKLGAEVQVMMTPQAKDFVSPLVISTLTRKPVLIEMFDEQTWSNHVMLGRWADMLLIAPASCNTIAKMATGICDNFLMATYMSATCPVHIAPAMDEDMWHHPTTTKNLQQLSANGNTIIAAQHGELASGLVGMGRMAELEDMIAHIDQFFGAQHTLKGKKIVISAGPTYENLDPVRFIGNYSTGKMGIAIAEECAKRGADVHLVLGPTNLTTKLPSITTYKVTSAAQMFDHCVAQFTDCDAAIMSAAVADYTPTTVENQKIKKKEGEFTITLTKTKDILKHLGTIKKANQYLVGFALESNDEENYAKGKLSAKNADMIVLNSTRDAGAGFGGDTNKITIFDKHNNTHTFDLKTKTEVATDIINQLINYANWI